MMPTSNAVASSSRARIGTLEGQVSSLWTAVKSLEAKLGSTPTKVNQPEPASEAHNGVRDNSREDRSGYSSSSDSSIPPSPTNPPTHLLYLFDSGSLDPSVYEPNTRPRHANDPHSSQDASPLIALLPSRQDMLTITANASSWLSWASALFPVKDLIKTGDEMLEQYDRILQSDTGVVPSSVFLLSVALTVQQAFENHSVHIMDSIPRTALFLKDVSDVVEKLVISNDEMLETLEGITCALLFLRL